MKFLQNALVVVAVLALGAVVWQYMGSSALDRRVGTTETQISETRTQLSGVSQTVDSHNHALKKQGDEIDSHGKSIQVQGKEIEAQGKDIEILKQKVSDAQKRLAELSGAADADRKDSSSRDEEIRKLRTDLDALAAKKDDLERREQDVDGLRQELKQSLNRSAMIERRLFNLEKRLGVETPQP